MSGPTECQQPGWAGNPGVLHPRARGTATPPSRLSLPPPARSPAHLSVSCFDDEYFGAGQGAGPEPQAHRPQGLPPEQEQREPRQRPDHGVVADGSPRTATVAAEPLHHRTRPAQLGGQVHPHSELARPSSSTCTRVQSRPTL